jgi:G3E family GTPase
MLLLRSSRPQKQSKYHAQQFFLFINLNRDSVPIDFMLDLHAFDNRTDGWFDYSLPTDCLTGSCNHGHDAHSHSDTHHPTPSSSSSSKHKVDSSVTTVMLEIESQVEIRLLEKWLQAVLWDRVLPGVDVDVSSINQQVMGVLRLKALIHTDDGSKVVIQAVHELYDKHPVGKWDSEKDGKGKIVLIGKAPRLLCFYPRIHWFYFSYVGRNLNRQLIKSSFYSTCITSNK